MSKSTVSPPIKRKRGRPKKIAASPAVRPPAKMGRPRAITPEMFPLIEKWSGKGWTDAQIADGLYVHSATYRRHKNGSVLSEEDNCALLLAIKRGRQVWWDKLDDIGDKHMNSPSGVSAWIFTKKQEAGGGWRDQQHMDVTGGITITVQRKLIGDDGAIDVTPQLDDDVR